MPRPSATSTTTGKAPGSKSCPTTARGNPFGRTRAPPPPPKNTTTTATATSLPATKRQQTQPQDEGNPKTDAAPPTGADEPLTGAADPVELRRYLFQNDPDLGYTSATIYGVSALALLLSAVVAVALDSPAISTAYVAVLGLCGTAHAACAVVDAAACYWAIGSTPRLRPVSSWRALCATVFVVAAVPLAAVVPLVISTTTTMPTATSTQQPSPAPGQASEVTLSSHSVYGGVEPPRATTTTTTTRNRTGVNTSSSVPASAEEPIGAATTMLVAPYLLLIAIPAITVVNAAPIVFIVAAVASVAVLGVRIVVEASINGAITEGGASDSFPSASHSALAGNLVLSAIALGGCSVFAWRFRVFQSRRCVAATAAAVAHVNVSDKAAGADSVLRRVVSLAVLEHVLDRPAKDDTDHEEDDDEDGNHSQQQLQQRHSDADGASLPSHRDQRHHHHHQQQPRGRTGSRALAQNARQSTRALAAVPATPAREVTVIFASIQCNAGSAAIAADPCANARLLHRVVSTYDALLSDPATAGGVVKVKTVGDIYWAVAGLPDAAPLHGSAACRFAVGMQVAAERLGSLLRERRAQRVGNVDGDGDAVLTEAGSIRVHVGVHTGMAAGVVLGTSQLSYEPSGPACDGALAALQRCSVDAVCITESTKRRLSLESTTTTAPRASAAAAAAAIRSKAMPPTRPMFDSAAEVEAVLCRLGSGGPGEGDDGLPSPAATTGVPRGAALVANPTVGVPSPLPPLAAVSPAPPPRRAAGAGHRRGGSNGPATAADPSSSSAAAAAAAVGPFFELPPALQFASANLMASVHRQVSQGPAPHSGGADMDGDGGPVMAAAAASQLSRSMQLADASTAGGGRSGSCRGESVVTIDRRRAAFVASTSQQQQQQLSTSSTAMKSATNKGVSKTNPMAAPAPAADRMADISDVQHAAGFLRASDAPGVFTFADADEETKYRAMQSAESLALRRVQRVVMALILWICLLAYVSDAGGAAWPSRVVVACMSAGALAFSGAMAVLVLGRGARLDEPVTLAAGASFLAGTLSVTDAASILGTDCMWAAAVLLVFVPPTMWGLPGIARVLLMALTAAAAVAKLGVIAAAHSADHGRPFDALPITYIPGAAAAVIACIATAVLEQRARGLYFDERSADMNRDAMAALDAGAITAARGVVPATHAPRLCRWITEHACAPERAVVEHYAKVTLCVLKLSPMAAAVSPATAATTGSGSGGTPSVASGPAGDQAQPHPAAWLADMHRALDGLLARCAVVQKVKAAGDTVVLWANPSTAVRGRLNQMDSWLPGNRREGSLDDDEAAAAFPPRHQPQDEPSQQQQHQRQPAGPSVGVGGIFVAELLFIVNALEAIPAAVVAAVRTGPVQSAVLGTDHLSFDLLGPTAADAHRAAHTAAIQRAAAAAAGRNYVPPPPSEPLTSNASDSQNQQSASTTTTTTAAAGPHLLFVTSVFANSNNPAEGGMGASQIIQSPNDSHRSFTTTASRQPPAMNLNLAGWAGANSSMSSADAMQPPPLGIRR